VPGTKKYQQFSPVIRSIGEPTVDPELLHLFNDPATNKRLDQVVTFANIPSTATNIQLGWYISTTAPLFTTSGGATAAVLLLDESKLNLQSAEPLTADAVNAAIDTTSGLPDGKVGGAGFGFWDGPDFPRPNDHTVSSTALPRRSSMSMKFALSDTLEVVLKQTAQDGLYLRYDC
jgi:hypothetical protein